jgi:hypothetical protein
MTNSNLVLARGKRGAETLGQGRTHDWRSKGLVWLVLMTGVISSAAGMAVAGLASPDQSAALMQAKLLPTDVGGGEYLSWSVAMDGDTLVVGAPGDGEYWPDVPGAVYVYVRAGGVWTQQAKLAAADGAPSDVFGKSVAINGDTLVIGAPYDDDHGTNSGSAYVFVRSGEIWTEQAKLTAADGLEFDQFGDAVAISGDTAIVGAWFDDDLGADSGSVYVFVRSGETWTQQAKLTAADGAADDRFGASLGISNDTLVVGAFGDDYKGHDAGSIYIFVRTGGVWSEQSKLTAADSADYDLFGFSVAISGDTVVAGTFPGNTGSAYVFVRNGGIWSEQAKLTPGDGPAYNWFGSRVAISGDTVVVGAEMDEQKGYGTGSAYVFIRRELTWTQQAKLTAFDAASGAWFGSSVAVCGDTVLVGSPGDNSHGEAAGAAYLYGMSKPPLADAGPQQQVRPGTRVTLTAGNSRDRDNSIASYHWKQLSGKRVKLSDPDKPKTNFIAPKWGKRNGILAFQVTVVDRGGMGVTDRCLVSVISNGRAPVAKTGKDQKVTGGALVTLDGSESRDPDGSALKYFWKQVSGPSVVLSDDPTAAVTFTAPTVGPAGATLGFRLTVIDAEHLGAETTTLVNVCAKNLPPRARAGKHQAVTGGKRVELDGSASSDPDDGIAFYHWQQLSGPPVSLSNPLGKKNHFISPQVSRKGTTLVFQLTVTDRGGLQSRSRCQVRVTGRP